MRKVRLYIKPDNIEKHVVFIDKAPAARRGLIVMCAGNINASVRDK